MVQFVAIFPFRRPPSPKRTQFFGPSGLALYLAMVEQEARLKNQKGKKVKGKKGKKGQNKENYPFRGSKPRYLLGTKRITGHVLRESAMIS